MLYSACTFVDKQSSDQYQSSKTQSFYALEEENVHIGTREYQNYALSFSYPNEIEISSVDITSYPEGYGGKYFKKNDVLFILDGKLLVFRDIHGRKWSITTKEPMIIPTAKFIAGSLQLYPYEMKQRYVITREGVFYTYLGSDKFMKNADPSSFEVLEPDCARDKNSGYTSDKMVKESHGPTFECLDQEYSRDQFFAYRFGEKIQGADGASFRVLDDVYSKDSKYVFASSRQIDDADPVTFQPIWKKYAADQNGVYRGGLFSNHNDIDIDVETFGIISDNCAKDKYHTYFIRAGMIAELVILDSREKCPID